MARHRTPLEIATSLNLAALHTGITLWHRWPLLMGIGGKRGASELHRMVSEKVAAGMEGLSAGQAEVARLTMAVMSGKSGNAFSASMSIADAAMRPAQRAVKNNSRRLSRRK